MAKALISLAFTLVCLTTLTHAQPANDFDDELVPPSDAASDAAPTVEEAARRLAAEREDRPTPKTRGVPAGAKSKKKGRRKSWLTRMGFGGGEDKDGNPIPCVPRYSFRSPLSFVLMLRSLALSSLSRAQDENAKALDRGGSHWRLLHSHRRPVLLVYYLMARCVIHAARGAIGCGACCAFRPPGVPIFTIEISRITPARYYATDDCLVVAGCCTPRLL